MLRSKSTAVKSHGSNHADACQNQMVLAHVLTRPQVFEIPPLLFLSGRKKASKPANSLLTSRHHVRSEPYRAHFPFRFAPLQDGRGATRRGARFKAAALC
jgi:hypothetical protein